LTAHRERQYAMSTNGPWHCFLMKKAKLNNDY
jgi:hypothetical protein